MPPLQIGNEDGHLLQRCQDNEFRALGGQDKVVGLAGWRRPPGRPMRNSETGPCNGRPLSPKARSASTAGPGQSRSACSRAALALSWSAASARRGPSVARPAERHPRSHMPAMSLKSSGPKRHVDNLVATPSPTASAELCAPECLRGLQVSNLGGHLHRCCKGMALGGCIVHTLGCCAQPLEHLGMLRHQHNAGGVRHLLPALQAFSASTIMSRKKMWRPDTLCWTLRLSFSAFAAWSATSLSCCVCSTMGRAMWTKDRAHNCSTPYLVLSRWMVATGPCPCSTVVVSKAPRGRGGSRSPTPAG